MISVSLKNPPSGAYYWLPVFYVSGVPYYLDKYFRLDEKWELAIGASGFMRFRAVTYSSNKSILATRDLSDVSVEDGHDYAYNWATNLWEDVTGLFGWIELAHKSIAITTAIVGGWVPLAQSQLIVKTAIVGGWVFLAQTSVAVTTAIVGGWILLAESSLALKKSIIFNWIQLAETSVAIKAKGIVPPSPEPPPEEEKKFPWLPVALIGGGAALVAAATKPKKIKP